MNRMLGDIMFLIRILNICFKFFKKKILISNEKNMYARYIIIRGGLKVKISGGSNFQKIKMNFLRFFSTDLAYNCFRLVSKLRFRT